MFSLLVDTGEFRTPTPCLPKTGSPWSSKQAQNRLPPHGAGCGPGLVLTVHQVRREHGNAKPRVPGGSSEVTVRHGFPFIVINADGGDSPQSCVFVMWSVSQTPRSLQTVHSPVQLTE
jgi:hypothetical protein